MRARAKRPNLSRDMDDRLIDTAEFLFAQCAAEGLRLREFTHEHIHIHRHDTHTYRQREVYDARRRTEIKSRFEIISFFLRADNRTPEDSHSAEKLNSSSTAWPRVFPLASPSDKIAGEEAASKDPRGKRKYSGKHRSRSEAEIKSRRWRRRW